MDLTCVCFENDLYTHTHTQWRNYHICRQRDCIGVRTRPGPAEEGTLSWRGPPPNTSPRLRAITCALPCTSTVAFAVAFLDVLASEASRSRIYLKDKHDSNHQYCISLISATALHGASLIIAQAYLLVPRLCTGQYLRSTRPLLLLLRLIIYFFFFPKTLAHNLSHSFEKT